MDFGREEANKKLKLAAASSSSSSSTSLIIGTAVDSKVVMEDDEEMVLDPSSLSTTASTTTGILLLAATKRLQRWWRYRARYHTTRHLVESVLQIGLSEASIKATSFESLVVMLREKPVIAAAKACLQRIHLQSVFRHGSPSKALSPENVNVRVFLAGFMIAYRPTHVFESMGTLEKNLLEATLPLMDKFHKICSHTHTFGSSLPHELTKDFPMMLFEFLKRFKAWKVPDEAKLTLRIKHALIALYQAEEHLPPDEPEDSKLKVEFRTQIERLRSKLQQIAGHDALKQFDEKRLAGQIQGSCGGGGNGNHQNHPHGGGGGGGAGAAYNALPGKMTNEQLAHELLLDPTFQLDESGGCGVENPVFHRIRESFHKAFWDSLVDDLKLQEPCFVRVLRVLSEIRDGIIDLAGNRVNGSIQEVLDLDFIKTQAEAGLFSANSSMALVEAIVVIVQQVQAPKRDLETKQKWQGLCELRSASDFDLPQWFCKAMEFLLDRVNAMRIDAANARLRLIAPVIKDHGIDYERGKFQDKLSNGALTLERTRKWIRGQVVRLSSAHFRSEKQKKEALGEEEAKMAKREFLDNLLMGKAQAFIKVHSDAMLSLITERPMDIGVYDHDKVPETLLFDTHRLHAMRKEFRNIVTRATRMLIAKYVVFAIQVQREEDKPKLNAMFQRIAAILDSDSEASLASQQGLDQMLSDVLAVLGDEEYAGFVLDIHGSTLKRQLSDCHLPSDNVNALMYFCFCFCFDIALVLALALA